MSSQQQKNDALMRLYRQMVPPITRLRNRLRHIGTTTVEQDRAIEALFNLLSPALQEEFILAPVKNAELAPVTGFAPIWTVTAKDTYFFDREPLQFDVPADNAEDAEEIYRNQFSPHGHIEVSVEPSPTGTGLDYDRLASMAVGHRDSPNS